MWFLAIVYIQLILMFLSWGYKYFVANEWTAQNCIVTNCFSFYVFKMYVIPKTEMELVDSNDTYILFHVAIACIVLYCIVLYLISYTKLKISSSASCEMGF